MFIVRRNILKVLFFIGLVFLQIGIAIPQPAPATDENIPFLVTFGANSLTSWGDDDFCQIFFCMVPVTQTEPVYIRIFDADIGGDYDEPKTDYNTKVKFSVFGGTGCWSNKDAQGIDPAGNFKSGIMLASEVFGLSPEYNKKWYTFGPFNPFEGEYVEKFDGRIFKIIAQGVSGDDGNLYQYYLSNSPDENKSIEGGNIFTYEYSFRLANDQKHVSQIYPFIDDKTVSIEISNFDWDDDGSIRVISVAKDGVLCNISKEDDWIRNELPIVEEEKNTSLEIQFVKNQNLLVKNNNVAIVVRNQYGLSLPFFVVPIGGIPVYSPKIKMKGF